MTCKVVLRSSASSIDKPATRGGVSGALEEARQLSMGPGKPLVHVAVVCQQGSGKSAYYAGKALFACDKGACSFSRGSWQDQLEPRSRMPLDGVPLRGVRGARRGKKTAKARKKR